MQGEALTILRAPSDNDVGPTISNSVLTRGSLNTHDLENFPKRAKLKKKK